MFSCNPGINIFCVLDDHLEWHWNFFKVTSLAQDLAEIKRQYVIEENDLLVACWPISYWRWYPLFLFVCCFIFSLKLDAKICCCSNAHLNSITSFLMFFAYLSCGKRKVRSNATSLRRRSIYSVKILSNVAKASFISLSLWCVVKPCFLLLLLLKCWRYIF